MSDCLHCDIHDLMESHLQNEETNLAEIAAKVTEVLADLILLAPPDERGTFYRKLKTERASLIHVAIDPSRPAGFGAALGANARPTNWKERRINAQ